jgi:hypothetical protein
MNLRKTIENLYAEKEKLERVIASLEELEQTAESAAQYLKGWNRRGRKSMGASERADVSKRMREYWANRKSTPGD